MKEISNISCNNQVIAQNSVLKLLKLIGTPKSYRIFNELEDGQVPNLDLNPLQYNDAYSYMLDAQAVALVKKCKYADFGIDTRKAAKDVWFESERKCSEMNRLLCNPAYLRDLSKNVTGILYTARNYLSRLLGPVPEISRLRFGPGSTVHSRGFKGSLPNKLENDNGIYSHTNPSYIMTLLAHNPMFKRSLFCDEDGNFVPQFHKVDYDVWDSVPKTYKTDRGISYGASLNMILQLGVHDHIVQRLKRWGVDLVHLPELHKRLAQQGSLDDSLATIDLQAASDSISLELARLILPEDWFYFLDNIRAKSTKVDEEVIALNKFCAMGCGFTFALETIIFMAIIWATAQIEGHRLQTMSVFGDDIIVDSELAEKLIMNLSHLGFQTNEDKTFTAGPFRESCGGDFFNGISVRPIYWKDIPDGIEGLYVIANRIRQTLRALNLNDYCPVDGYAIWQDVIGYIPENLRYFGPASCGDRVIIAARSEWIGYSRYRDQQLRITCLGRAYDRKGRARPRKGIGKLAYALYTLGFCDNPIEHLDRNNLAEKHQRDNVVHYLKRTLGSTVTSDGQIMGSTKFKVVKRNTFVYFYEEDESYMWY